MVSWRSAVNRLVDALLTNSEVVDRAARDQAASFDLLAGALGDSLLSAPERELIDRNDDLRQRLRACYLPSITAQDWDGALRLTEGDEIATGWWTVMIAATTGVIGLTAPQDSSVTGLIALFTGSAHDAGLLIYDPARGHVVDLPPDAHCVLAPDGLCPKGSCGQCKSKTVWDKTGRGIRCSCLHQRVR
jgi:hypothetical protein